MSNKIFTVNYRLTLLTLSLIILFNEIVNAQMSHQELLDALSSKISTLQVQLKEIKNNTSKENISSENNTELISGIRKSINQLEASIEKNNIDEANSNAREQKLLAHLSNMEGSLNKLVQLKLEEQTKKEISETDVEPLQTEAAAQHSFSLGFGTDLVSRYVWRGGDFGDSPSIQPFLAISYAGFELGTWASYPFTSVADFNEHDLYLSYTHESDVGSFGLVLTDFYYPNLGAAFSNWKGEGEGAHTLELSASYAGPFNLLAAYNIHNDPDKSFYVELGYSHTAADVPIDIFVGCAKGKSAWYGITTNKIEITNVGIKGSKEIAFTDKLSFTLAASYILNPYARKSFLVIGISI